MTETSTSMKSTSGTVFGEVMNQKLLNGVFGDFDILLVRTVPDGNYLLKSETIKQRLRELFNNLEKKNHVLQKQIDTLELCVSSLEGLENDDSRIKMGNIALQLRNKLVGFIKPTLSYRAARDEYLAILQTEDRYPELTKFIKSHHISLSTADLSRQIKTLLNAHVSKAHAEAALAESEIDIILHDYAAQNDEYLIQAANTVVRFLKLLSEYLDKPLIVNSYEIS